MKLWAFGCSHTQGHGLADCIAENGIDPIPVMSKLSWPNHLAELMGIDCEIKAWAGAGIKSTWHECVSAPIEPDDVIAIMWPCWESRIDILLPPEDIDKSNPANIIHIRSWHEQDKDYFNRYYSAYDQFMQLHCYTTTIRHMYPDNQIINTAYNEQEQLWDIKPLMNQPFSTEYFGAHKYQVMPLAQDGQHRGIEAHKALAENLFAEFKLT